MNNSGEITVQSTNGNAYGLYVTTGKINNLGEIVVETTTGRAYGFYATTGTISNTMEVMAKATSGEAYGVYTNGAIDLSKFGNVKAEAENGIAIAVRFGRGVVELNDVNMSYLSAISDGTRYLVDGANVTSSSSKTRIINKSLTNVSAIFPLYFSLPLD